MASWLTSFYQPSKPITDDRICITGGASQNLACLLQVFTDPVYTRNVWIVAPAYMLAFRIFDDNALKLRAVPEDEEGINVEYLRQEIKKREEEAQAQGNNQPVSIVYLQDACTELGYAVRPLNLRSGPEPSATGSVPRPAEALGQLLCTL